MDGSESPRLERPIDGEPPFHHHDLAFAPSVVGVDHHEDDDDDDFELGFSFDQQRGSESPGQSLFRSEEYRQLFHLPSEEVLVQDFNCALQKKILLQGHMYLFEHYVCFYSNIFGYEKKKVIILKDVTCVRKAKTAGLFPNAIEIVAWGKKNFFASFLSRDEAYRLIVEGWARHSRYAKLATDSQGNLSPAPLTSNAVEAQDQLDPSYSESSFGSRDIVEVPEQSGERGCEADMVGGSNDLETSEVLQQTNASNAIEDGNVQNAQVDSAIMSTLWEVEDDDAPEVPEHYKAVLECELPVDVKEFFQLFYSNDSAKFCESFHKKRGDEDFHCTKWAKHRHFGHARDVSFRHPIKVYFGPKASYCQEVQRYHIYRNSHLIIETSQQMNDIPYGDYFRVEGRWDVVPLTGGRNTSHCSVRAFVDVPFFKKTVWKGKIEQGTYYECKEDFAAWLSEALRILQEKGLACDKFVRGADANLLSSYAPPGSAKSAKSTTYLPKPKRKLEAGSGQVQGHAKLSKQASFAPPSQTFAERQQQQQPQTVSSSPLKSPQFLHQGFSLLTSISQMKLLMALSIMAVILLIQLGTIIALARSSKMHYILVGPPQGIEYYGSHVRHCGRQDAITILEQHAHFLQEEIAIAEARLQTLEYNVNLLKVQLHLVEKMPQKSMFTS